MLRNAFFSSVMVLCLTVVASAAPTTVAPHVQFDQGGLHEFFISTTGEAGDEFQGVDLQFEIMPSNGNLGPLVTVVDLTSDGLLFHNNNTGIGDFADPQFLVPGRAPGYFTTSIPGASQNVGPNGLLARIVVDTTGIAPGTYEINLNHSMLGQSDLPPYFTTDALISNGSITVVPEPGSIVLGAFAAAGLGAVVIRRRRARKA